MGNANKYAAFSNEGDWVLLSGPDGTPVCIVSWGEFEQTPPRGDGLIAEQIDPARGGSACRYWFGGPMASHNDIDGTEMSPGRFPVGPTPDEAAAMAAQNAAEQDSDK
jgi:hypothetical protein